jgi:PBP1b-binding outer membrane lipoprotein LpoB
MKNTYYLIIALFVFILQSCESKKETKENLTENNTAAYENVLDVPVEKLAVIVNIDSLGFFNHNSQNLETEIPSATIEKELKQVNSKFDVCQAVKDKSAKILQDNKYDFEMMKELKQIKLPTDLIEEKHLKEIKFDELKKQITQNDLLVINVKSGLDYNPDNKKEYIAKTYIYLSILDLKNKALKYNETIGGTKYIDQEIKNLTPDNLSKLIKESVNETLEIIDKKY